MKEGPVPKAHGTICLPFSIDQKWKCDSSLLAKEFGISCVAQTDGGQPNALVLECRFVVAQLRNMLAAEDSSVVAKEYDNSRPVGPERAEAQELSGRIRQNDFRQPFAHR